MTDKKYTIIYIAGPMTGIPEFNYPAFFAAEADLIKRFPRAEVINPARNFGKATGLTHADYMRRCIPQVLLATHMYVLKGWQNSVGANWEVKTAQMLEVPIMFERAGANLFESVVGVVADMYEIHSSLILSDTRKQDVVEARSVCMYWLTEACGKTCVWIGQQFNRDHSSVIYANKRVRDQLKIDAKFRRRYEALQPLLVEICRNDLKSVDEEASA